MSEYRFAKRLVSKTRRPTAKSVRTTNYGPNWGEVSAKCLRLANRVCADCGARACRAHHIIPKSRGGSDSQINLKAVCETCHNKYHRHLR